MAIMRPSEFPQDRKNNEDREHFVYEMLKKNLPLDAVVIYEPLVFNRGRQNRKPDFVVFWPGVGCFVLEVKNWSRAQINSADDRQVYYGQDSKPRTNPFRSADCHAIAVKNHLEQRCTAESGILQTEAAFKGKLSFPVTPAVLLLGTKDSDMEDWANLLCVDRSVLVSEQALQDSEAFQAHIRQMPRVFPGEREAQILRAAADILREGSETEPSVDAAARSIDKLKQQLAQPLLKDLETLTAHRRLLATIAEDLATNISVDHEDHPNSKNLLQLRDDLNESRLRVGLFGTSAAGKSTLTNALIGKTKYEPDLMREGLGRTTRVITRILPVGIEKEQHHRCSLLRYKSAADVAEELGSRLKQLGIFEEEFPDASKPINLADVKHKKWLEAQIQAVEKGGPQYRDQSNALKAMLKGWDECQALLGTDVAYDANRFADAESLIHGSNQQHASYVAERIIYHDNRLTEHGIELIDAPGVGAAVQDDDRALEIAQTADAFVVVTDVKFQFMQADRQFLMDAVDVTRGQRNNLLFVINQISKIVPDQCDPPAKSFDDAVDSQVDRFRSTLADYGVDAAKVWPVDAAAGKASRQMKFAKPNAKSRENFELYRFRDLTDVDDNLAASRLEQLEEHLISHLTKHTYTDVMCDKVSRLEKELAGYEDDLSDRIENIKREIGSVLEEMEVHKKSRKRVQLQLDGFFAKHLPGQLERYKTEQLSDIKDLVDFAIDEIEQNAKRQRFEFKLTIADVVNTAIKNSEPAIAARIKSVRVKYENIWTAIKTNALDKELPDILAEYQGDVPLHFESRDIREALKSRVLAMQGIHLTIFQRMYAGLWAIWERFKLNGNGEAFRSSVAASMRVNFEGKMRDQFRDDVYKWICDDQDSLNAQTLQQFTTMMDNIESRIRKKLDDLKRCEGNRAEYERKLKRFKTQVEAKRTDLREIRRLIEVHRPMEAQDIA